MIKTPAAMGLLLNELSVMAVLVTSYRITKVTTRTARPS